MEKKDEKEADSIYVRVQIPYLWWNPSTIFWDPQAEMRLSLSQPRLQLPTATILLWASRGLAHVVQDHLHISTPAQMLNKAGREQETSFCSGFHSVNR
jgi:hypothetical protein